MVGSSTDRSHALIASTRAIDRRLDPKTEPRPRRIPDRPHWASSGTGNTESSHHRTGKTTCWSGRLDPASPHRVPEVQGHGPPIVILCSEGCTSSLAAAVLQDLGLHRATDLIGGFEAWEAADQVGRPVQA